MTNIIGLNDTSFISRKYPDQILENCIAAYKDAVGKQDLTALCKMPEVQDEDANNQIYDILYNANGHKSEVPQKYKEQFNNIIYDATLTQDEKHTILLQFERNIVSHLHKETKHRAKAANHLDTLMLMGKNQALYEQDYANVQSKLLGNPVNFDETYAQNISNLDEALTYFRATSNNKELANSFLGNVTSLLSQKRENIEDFNKILDQALVQTICQDKLPEGISANNIYDQLAQKWDTQNVDSDKKLPNSDKTLKDIGIGTVSAKVDLIQSVINKVTTPPAQQTGNNAQVNTGDAPQNNIDIESTAKQCIEQSNARDVMAMRTYLIEKHGDGVVPDSITGSFSDVGGRRILNLAQAQVDNLKQNPISYKLIENYEQEIANFKEKTELEGWKYNEKQGYWSRPLTSVIEDRNLITQLIDNYAQNHKSDIKIQNDKLVIKSITTSTQDASKQAAPVDCIINYNPPIEIDLNKVQVVPAEGLQDLTDRNRKKYQYADSLPNVRLRLISDEHNNNNNENRPTITITQISDSNHNIDGTIATNSIASNLDPRFITINSSVQKTQLEDKNFHFQNPCNNFSLENGIRYNLDSLYQI